MVKACQHLRGRRLGQLEGVLDHLHDRGDRTLAAAQLEDEGGCQIQLVPAAAIGLKNLESVLCLGDLE